jgi:hypothetical protein
MRQGAEARDESALLAAALAAGADEHAGVLAPEGARGPLLARLVPEGLELRREVSVAGRDAKEDAVELLELGGVVEDGHVGLGWGVHLGEDLIGKGLGDSGGGVRLRLGLVGDSCGMYWREDIC